MYPGISSSGFIISHEVNVIEKKVINMNKLQSLICTNLTPTLVEKNYCKVSQ
jgi:hypothetical protein